MLNSIHIFHGRCPVFVPIPYHSATTRRCIREYPACHALNRQEDESRQARRPPSPSPPLKDVASILTAARSALASQDAMDQLDLVRSARHWARSLGTRDADRARRSPEFQSLLRALLAHCRRPDAAPFSDAELVELTGLLARIVPNFKSHSALDALQERVKRNASCLHALSFASLVDLYWSIAKITSLPSSKPRPSSSSSSSSSSSYQSIVKAIAKELISRKAAHDATPLPDATCADLARIAWSTARLLDGSSQDEGGATSDDATTTRSLLNPPLAHSLLSSVVEKELLQGTTRRLELTDQDCSMILWACARVSGSRGGSEGGGVGGGGVGFTPSPRLLQQLAAALERQGGRMGPQALANTAWALSVLGERGGGLPSVLLERAETLLRTNGGGASGGGGGDKARGRRESIEFRPQEVATVLAAFARLGVDPAQLLPLALRHLKDSFSSYQALDLSSILVSLATWDYASRETMRDDGLVDRLVTSIFPPSSSSSVSLDPYRMSTTLWALARLAPLTSAASRFSLIRAAHRNLDEETLEYATRPRALARMLWALASLDAFPSLSLTRRIAKSLVEAASDSRVVGQCDARTMATMLWSLAASETGREAVANVAASEKRGREKSEEVDHVRLMLIVLSLQLEREMEGMEGRSLSQALWSFAKLSCDPGLSFMEAASDRLMNSANTMSLPSIALTLYGFAELGYLPSLAAMVAVMNELGGDDKGGGGGKRSLRRDWTIRDVGMICVTLSRMLPALEEDGSVEADVESTLRTTLSIQDEGQEERDDAEGKEEEEVSMVAGDEASNELSDVSEDEIEVNDDEKERVDALSSSEDEEEERAEMLTLRRDELFASFLLRAATLVRDAAEKRDAPLYPYSLSDLCTAAFGIARLSRHYVRIMAPSAEAASVRRLRVADVDMLRALAERIKGGEVRDESSDMKSEDAMMDGVAASEAASFEVVETTTTTTTTKQSPPLTRRPSSTLAPMDAARLLWAVAKLLPPQESSIALSLCDTLLPHLIPTVAPVTFSPSEANRAAWALWAAASLRYHVGEQRAETMLRLLTTHAASFSTYEIFLSIWALTEMGLLTSYTLLPTSSTPAAHALIDIVAQRIPTLDADASSSTSSSDLSLSPRDAVLFCWALATLSLSTHPVFETLSLRVRYLPRNAFGGERLFETRDGLEFMVQNVESLDGLRRLIEVESMAREGRDGDELGRRSRVPFRFPLVIRQRALLAIGSVDVVAPPPFSTSSASSLLRTEQDVCQEIALVLESLHDTSQVQVRRMFSGGHVVLWEQREGEFALVPAVSPSIAINRPECVCGAALARAAILVQRGRRVAILPIHTWSSWPMYDRINRLYSLYD